MPQDDGMVAIKNTLRGAEGRPNLDGVPIDADVKATLERGMPMVGASDPFGF
jgi:hypothetical protein